MRRRRITIGLAGALALVGGVALVWPRADVRVKVFDPSLRLTGVHVLRRPNDKVYLGNQLEGGLRDTCRSYENLPPAR